MCSRFSFFIIIATKGVFDARSQRKVLKNTPFAHIPPPAPSHRKQENQPKKPTLASQSGKSIKAWKINNKSPTSRPLIQLDVAFLRDVNRGSNTSNKLKKTMQAKCCFAPFSRDLVADFCSLFSRLYVCVGLCVLYFISVIKVHTLPA